MSKGESVGVEACSRRALLDIEDFSLYWALKTSFFTLSVMESQWRALSRGAALEALAGTSGCFVKDNL